MSHRTVGHQKYTDEDLLLAAELALAMRMPYQALCLLAAHETYLQRADLVDYPRLRHLVISMHDAARSSMDTAAADAAWMHGLAQTQDAAVGYALQEVLNPLRSGAAFITPIEMEQVPMR